MSTAPSLDIVLPEAGRDAPVFVAYSGGLDSTVLMHALAAMPAVRARGLRAIHVHHGLAEGADAWTAHCERTCASLDVPLRIARAVVDRRSGLGLEAAAREARHAALAAGLDAGALLALAHHRDDQAETFLLRALRASGPDGLAAMRTLRPFARGWLWRPLLGVDRDTLRDYAAAHRLAWIEDPANAALVHDRNFLRHAVLPLLRERWPHAGAALARSAALAADAADLLAAADAHALAAAGTGDPRVLRISQLRLLPAARRARVLRAWIAGLGLPPLPARGLEAIEDDLLDADPDAAPVFAWLHARVQRWRDLLHADVARPPLPADFRIPWDGRAPLPLPGGGELRLLGIAGFDGRVQVHARHGGERILLPGRRHSHTLKHVLQALGVPPWLRARLPLLSDADGRLLAAGDLCHAAAFERWLHEQDARLAWRDPARA